MTFFIRVDGLVCEGGIFVGYTPVFQGDNTGPHMDSVFYNFVTAYC